MKKTLVLIPILALYAALAPARQEPQDEERIDALARGRRAFEDNCLMCHGAPIVASQRLTDAQWKAELTKMIGWGAPVPEEDRDVLLDYLNDAYGATVPRVRPDRVNVRRVESELLTYHPENYFGPTQGDSDGESLYRKHCASCHGPDVRGGDLGTNLVRHPVLLRRAEFLRIVREGRRRMPGFGQVLDPREEVSLFLWISRRDFPSAK